MEYITLNNKIEIPQLGLGTYLLKTLALLLQQRNRH